MSNNLGLPNNIYSGGSVALPSTYTQLYVNTQARNQARDEALTKYFMDFSKDVTPAGMRSEDINNGWGQKVAAWKQFGIDNLDALKNPQKDNYKAYSQFMSMHNDLLSDAARSKDATKGLASLAPVINDPNKRALLTDQTQADIQAAGKSIYDPAYKPIDATSLNYNPKPYTAMDIAKDQAILKNIQGWHSNEIISDVKDKNNPSKNIVTYAIKFKPEQLQGIQLLAENRYNTNPGFKDAIDKDINSQDPAIYKKYNDVYKKYYGTDISHPEEMAAAHMLLLHPETSWQVEKSNAVPQGRKGASTAPSSLWANNTATIIRSGNPDAIKSQFEKLFGGNTSNKYQSYETLPNGHYLIHYKGDRQIGTHTLHNQDLTEELDPNDPSLKYRLEGTYQRHMGSDAKGEGQIISEPIAPATIKPATPTNKGFVIPKGVKL